MRLGDDREVEVIRWKSYRNLIVGNFVMLPIVGYRWKRVGRRWVGTVSDSATRNPIGFRRIVGFDRIRSDPVSDPVSHSWTWVWKLTIQQTLLAHQLMQVLFHRCYTLIDFSEEYNRRKRPKFSGDSFFPCPNVAQTSSPLVTPLLNILS
jgi:hypothetical protein